MIGVTQQPAVICEQKGCRHIQKLLEFQIVVVPKRAAVKGSRRYSVLCLCFRLGCRQGSVISKMPSSDRISMPCMTAAEVRYSSLLMLVVA